MVGISLMMMSGVKEMPTGRESVLNELREQEFKKAKKIVEVNIKILKAVREEYRRLLEELSLEECSDPKTEAVYDDVLEAMRWNYEQSARWLCDLERSNRVCLLEEGWANGYDQ